jgi:hypothetical protein
MEMKGQLDALVTLPKERASDTNWTGVWMGPRVSLYQYRIENSFTLLKSNPNSQSRIQPLYSSNYPGSIYHLLIFFKRYCCILHFLFPPAAYVTQNYFGLGPVKLLL